MRAQSPKGEHARDDQFSGSERPERIGRAVWQAVLLGLATVPLMLLTIPLAPAVIHWAGHPAEVASLEIEFYRALCWGESTLVLAAALSSFFTDVPDPSRIVAVTEAESDRSGAPSRPTSRTTEDYLRERVKGAEKPKGES